MVVNGEHRTALDSQRVQGARALVGLGCAAAILALPGLMSMAEAQNPYVATRWSGRSVVLHGRVVTPEGSPIADAEIQVFTPRMPHNPPRAIVEARSAPDGTFTLGPVRASAVDAVVIRGGGGHLTFDRRVDRSARGRVSLGSFVLGPERDVPFVIHCRSELVPHPRQSPWASMRVDVFQMPANERIVSGYLSPEMPGRPLSELPGRETSGHSSFALDQRELRATIRLPIGEHTVVLGGSCGHSVTTLRVPSAGAVAFEQTLPVTGRDSDLEIEVAPGAGVGCPASVSVLADAEQQAGGIEVALMPVECGRPLRVERLPPTRAVVIIGRRSCEVPLRAGETARVVVDGRRRCRIEP